jgi:hypothetical protein
MSKTISIIVVIALVVAVAAAAIIALTSCKPQVKNPDRRPLMDVNPNNGVLWEEDGDPAELARRIIDLAAGSNFSAAQLHQIRVLTGDMFEDLRTMGMDIELLQIQVRRLQEQLAAK